MLKYYLIFSILIVFISSQPGCRQGWIQHNGTCYFFSNYTTFFSNAWKVCNILGGKLAEPDTRDEIDFLGKKVRETGENHFTGIADYDHEGQWVYVSNNRRVKLTDWAPNEPTPTKATVEDCGEIGIHGRWADVVCDSIPRYYICETTLPSVHGGLVVG